ncbi:gamma carbonic anhydrase family protein [Fluviispira sanaruensis]|uniref:Gamma carbonic anhydrase family protein n=1 Tax=Fluviispira sanaruensis TaxID=2493639 RepID=A0A4V0P289_FLUSA|nr:gamma carbonic anhydrase family protein [Fluviispira sanaruensis]BBH52387.1 gamma carbonic anhydrase family protein [Fluviispira sanaruensis]
MNYTVYNNLPDIKNAYFIAPNADIIGNVQIGRASSVWFGAVIRGDSEMILIGEETNIQDLCVLHADGGINVSIGNRVTIGHKCMIHGCTIGDNSLIGIGAIILNNAKIGKNCMVGAGSLVLENTIIPDNSLVVGSPAKVKRLLTEEEINKITQNAINYKNKSLQYNKMEQPRLNVVN